MSEPTFLICARADAPIAHPQTDYSRSCSRCGMKVMIYPLGQRRLHEMPDLIIVCSNCFLDEAELLDETTEVEPVAPVEDMLRESKQSGPNPYRRRN